jgi:hypothetical protein
VDALASAARGEGEDDPAEGEEVSDDAVVWREAGRRTESRTSTWCRPAGAPHLTTAWADRRGRGDAAAPGGMRRGLLALDRGTPPHLAMQRRGAQCSRRWWRIAGRGAVLRHARERRGLVGGDLV